MQNLPGKFSFKYIILNLHYLGEYPHMCPPPGVLDGLQEVLCNDAGRNEQGPGTQVCRTEQREEGDDSLPGIVDINYQLGEQDLESCPGADAAGEGGEEAAEVQGAEHAQAWQEALHPH